MSSSIFDQAYRRRSVLKSLAAAGTLPFTAPLVASTVLASGNKYAGRTINLLIIQPHVVTGKKIAEDFERLTGAKVNVTAVPYDQVSVKATLDCNRARTSSTSSTISIPTRASSPRTA